MIKTVIIKSRTTARLAQRGIFETIFRLARSAFLKLKCFEIMKMKLQYNKMIEVVKQTVKVRGLLLL